MHESSAQNGGLTCIVSIAWGGMASSESMTRESATKMCWMEAHKEYPKYSGNDIDNTALARDAYAHYASCMERQGLKP
jgi:hypothetical protein